jgi:DNA replication protein DnaC
MNCWLKDKCYKGKTTDCENSFCIKRFKLDTLYNKSLITNKQREFVALRLDADGTDREAFIKLKSIEDNIEMFVSEGCNLYLYSSQCGNGKTAWSLRMLQSYLSKIWHKSDLECRVLFVHVPRLLLELKDNISNKSEYVSHIKENVLNADLVVWDEVGTKAATVFEHENLLNMINTRIESNKSNIYTSNLQPTELRERLGDRLFSRVFNYSTTIELFGKDKRGII